MLRSTRSPFAVLLFAAILAGCASPNVQVGVQTRAEIYDPSLDVPTIVAATPPRLAILPTVVTGTSAGFAPFVNISLDRLVREARQGTSEAFIPFLEGLTGRRGSDVPPLSIYSVSDVVNGLNAYGRGADLTSLLEDTARDSVADRSRLMPVARALGVEYLMIPWLAGVDTDNANRFTFAGFSFLRTGWISIEITLQLWHAPTGRLVWQSVGSGNIVGEGVVGTSPGLAESVEQLLRPMLRAFMTGDSELVVATEVAAPTAPAAATPAAPTEAPEEASPSESASESASNGASEEDDGSSATAPTGDGA